VLGSVSEADDAVQETWLWLSRSGADGVDNLGGWLTTIVARVSLNILRSRTSRREEPMDTPAVGQPVTGPVSGTDPEHEAVLADSVGLAQGADSEVIGVRAVACTFRGRAAAARPALIDGAAGAVWAQGGKPRVVFAFTIAGGKVAAIEMIADPERIGQFEVVLG
jgi:hypothetical protein